MNTYSIGSDSPRWWWPSAAAGAAGAAAIAAILVLPTTVSTGIDEAPEAPPAPAGPVVVDDWVTTVDPGLGRLCFALRARPRDAQAYDPRCGHQPTRTFPDGSRRPGLDSRP
jgi:hypothetical protein